MSTSTQPVYLTTEELEEMMGSFDDDAADENDVYPWGEMSDAEVLEAEGLSAYIASNMTRAIALDLHPEMAELAGMVKGDAYVPKHSEAFRECYEGMEEGVMHGLGAQE